MKCSICQEERSTIAKLSKHIRDAHSMSSRAYYDSHIKLSGMGSCRVCSKPTRFINMGIGYKPTCSKACGIKMYRADQRTDPVRHAAFVGKVKINQARIWKERTDNGSATEIRTRIGQTVARTAANLTKEERSERYGWLNKLSDEERKVRIEEILDKSLRKYAAENRVIHDIENWWGYAASVRLLTERTYKRFQTTINPKNLPRGCDKYHLDHRLSVVDGYLNGIPVEVVASVHNLQMLSAIENMVKHCESSITPEELIQSWRDAPL